MLLLVSQSTRQQIALCGAIMRLFSKNLSVIVRRTGDVLRFSRGIMRNKHGVAVTEKAILLVHCRTVSRHGVLIARKR